MVRNANARSDVQELLRRYHGAGDIQARQTVIEESAPLVRSLARHYVGRGEPFEDLLQVGMVGLIKAVDRFDPSRGVEFSTYATELVLGEIKRYFRDCTALVQVPRATQELSVRIRRSAESLTQTLGHEPTVPELAEALAVPTESVLDGIEAGRSVRVETLLAHEGDIGDLGDPSRLLDGEDGAISRLQDRTLLRNGLSALEPREQQVIVLRHVFELTQTEIADRVGFSQMHVSRLLRRATRKVQIALTDREELAA